MPYDRGKWNGSNALHTHLVKGKTVLLSVGSLWVTYVSHMMSSLMVTLQNWVVIDQGSGIAALHSMGKSLLLFSVWSNKWLWGLQHLMWKGLWRDNEFSKLNHIFTPFLQLRTQRTSYCPVEVNVASPTPESGPNNWVYIPNCAKLQFTLMLVHPGYQTILRPLGTHAL